VQPARPKSQIGRRATLALGIVPLLIQPLFFLPALSKLDDITGGAHFVILWLVSGFGFALRICYDMKSGIANVCAILGLTTGIAFGLYYAVGTLEYVLAGLFAGTP